MNCSYGASTTIKLGLMKGREMGTMMLSCPVDAYVEVPAGGM